MTIRHDIRADRRQAAARKAYAFAAIMGGGDTAEGRRAMREAAHYYRSARRERALAWEA